MKNSRTSSMLPCANRVTGISMSSANQNPSCPSLPRNAWTTGVRQVDSEIMRYAATKLSEEPGGADPVRYDLCGFGGLPGGASWIRTLRRLRKPSVSHLKASRSSKKSGSADRMVAVENARSQTYVLPNRGSGGRKASAGTTATAQPWRKRSALGRFRCACGNSTNSPVS